MTEVRHASRREPGPAKFERNAVEDYLTALAHPLKAEIQAFRAIVRGASPKIAEGIKWNAPSYACGGAHFATFNPRAKDGVQLVFHLGAKVRADSAVRAEVDDPAKLLRWLADDRASVTFQDMHAIEAQAEACKPWCGSGSGTFSEAAAARRLGHVFERAACASR
jgi:hypothetical protein